MDRLIRERAITLGNTLDSSTLHTYTSTITSYLTFMRAHNFPVSPSEDTISYYIVYMSHHISPHSVTTYLSGIVQQLEPFYPSIREIQHSRLVQRTLQGCMKTCTVPTQHKQALPLSELSQIVAHYYQSPPSHDDLLFVTLLLTGFFTLLRLGEMVFPDDKNLRNWRKISPRCTTSISTDGYHFELPFHKANRFFADNEILITRGQTEIDPILHFSNYINSCNALMPLHSALWLRADGTVPTRSFFIRRFHLFFRSDFGGQSMHAGGATFLAELGTPPSLIQARGRWSSDAFLIYIRKNPALLINLITAQR